MDTKTASFSCLAVGVHLNMPITDFMKEIQWLVSIGWTQRCQITIDGRQLDFSLPKRTSREIIGWADVCAIGLIPGAMEMFVQRHRFAKRLGMSATALGSLLLLVSFLVWQYASPRWNFVDHLMFKSKLTIVLFGPLAAGILSLVHARSLMRRLEWLQKYGEQIGGGDGIPPLHR
jgi:hypothetical protein